MMMTNMMIRLEVITDYDGDDDDDGGDDDDVDDDDVFGWLCNSWTTVDVIVRCGSNTVWMKVISGVVVEEQKGMEMMIMIVMMVRGNIVQFASNNIVTLSQSQLDSIISS